MNIWKTVWFLALAFLSCHVLGATVEKSDVLSHDRRENFISEHFNTNRFLESLHLLQSLGKDRAIARLTEYYNVDKFDGFRGCDVILLCHELFVNPNGWPLIVLPQNCEPAVNPDIAKTLTSFPLVFQDKVPILLIKGSSLGGRGLSVEDCIEKCKECEMTKNEFNTIPESDAKKAEIVFINSDIFKKLYADKSEIEEMSEFIAGQAKSEESLPGANK